MSNPTLPPFLEGKAAGYLGSPRGNNAYAQAVHMGFNHYRGDSVNWDTGWQWGDALRQAGAPMAYSTFEELHAWKAHAAARETG